MAPIVNKPFDIQVIDLDELRSKTRQACIALPALLADTSLLFQHLNLSLESFISIMPLKLLFLLNELFAHLNKTDSGVLVFHDITEQPMLELMVLVVQVDSVEHRLTLYVRLCLLQELLVHLLEPLVVLPDQNVVDLLGTGCNCC